MSREAFFDDVRVSLFKGSLTQGQVDGLNTLLNIWIAGYDDFRPEMLAYCLATAFHETARTMQPIEEYGTDARAEKLYGPTGRNPTRARKMGNTRKGDGARYKGRGYVQLTWKVNYRKAGKVVGVDLVADPKAALEPNIAARILYQGCLEGWFTGRKLSDYINDRETDYVDARRVVNGTDRASQIARYASKFEAAIEASDVLTVKPPAPPKPDPVPEPPKPDKPAGGFLTAIINAILKLFGKRKS